MMKNGILITFFALLVSACSTQQPIHNINGSLVPTKADGSLLSEEEVRKAIFDAATYKRWRVSSKDEDTVLAQITVRGRHSASVEIDYDQLSYSITLQNSDGLKQSNGKIHRNYNKWVILLDQQIQTELVAAADSIN